MLLIWCYVFLNMILSTEQFQLLLNISDSIDLPDSRQMPPQVLAGVLKLCHVGKPFGLVINYCFGFYSIIRATDNVKYESIQMLTSCVLDKPYAVTTQ